jgi:hypothetical protein
VKIEHMQSLAGLALVGIDYTYGQLCTCKGILLKSELNTPGPNQSQHDRPAHWVIAQEYFLATSFSLRFHSCKKNFGAKMTLSSFLPLFKLPKCQIALFEIAYVYASVCILFLPSLSFRPIFYFKTCGFI